MELFERTYINPESGVAAFSSSVEAETERRRVTGIPLELNIV